MTGRDAEQDVFRRPATPVNVPPPLPNLGRMTTLASWGEQLARALLQEPLPRRWAHVQGVAARALDRDHDAGGRLVLGPGHDIGVDPARQFGGIARRGLD